jgi:hypothetical protein
MTNDNNRRTDDDNKSDNGRGVDRDRSVYSGRNIDSVKRTEDNNLADS